MSANNLPTKIDNDVKYIIIDLFAGAGGTSTGFERAKKNGKKMCSVAVAINHDDIAIKSHSVNHVDCSHFVEDIKTFNINTLKFIINSQKKLYPKAKVVLWASLECTNHSKAKGGMSRDADSRTLANHLFRYFDAYAFDYVMIENVSEFKLWGPLRIKGHEEPDGLSCKLITEKKKKDGSEPYVMVGVKEKQGVDFDAWVKEMNSYGYTDEWRNLTSADYGVPTIRNRLFGCFTKNGNKPLAWPKQTHAKDPSKVPGTKKWVPVKGCLDLDELGASAIYRNKPLCENTLKKLYAGLIKHVKNGSTDFIVKYNSVDAKTGSMDRCNSSIEDPSPILGTMRLPQLSHLQYMFNYYSTGNNTHSIKEPARTIVCADMHYFITVEQHMMYNYSKPLSHKLEEPTGSLLCNPKQLVVSAEKSHYIWNSGWKNTTPYSLDRPCNTIVASQHKSPMYLITCERGNFNIPVYDSDSETMIKIKKFMAENCICNVYMRSLKPVEMLRIQSFGSDYKLFGSQANQKKQIGNSVTPDVVTKWIEAN